MTREAVAQALERNPQALSYIERRVLELLYGVGAESTPHTPDEVGRTFNVRREQIHRIEKQALRRLTAA